MFGDDDPEDAWDAGDPAGRLLDLLERWVHHLAVEVAGTFDRTRVVTRWVSARRAVDELRARHVSPVALDGVLGRLAAIADDLQL